MTKPSLAKLWQRIQEVRVRHRINRRAMKAALDRRGQHLVAIYSGGLQMSLFPYEIDWYPGAFTSTQNVGQFVGAEEWKPQV